MTKTKKVAVSPVAKTVFKLVLGLVLVAYVLRSGMVDFKTLRSVLTNPTNLLISFAFLSFSTLCCGFRWYLLVRAQGLSPSFRNLLELTMIANFFNTFMPGSVGGDLIKAWYIAGQQPQNKTKAVFTVLLDRVIGLAVIIFYAAVTLAFYSGWLKERPQLQILAYSIWAFSALSIIGALLFFASKGRPNGLSQRLLNRVSRFKRLHTITEALLLYRKHTGTVVIAIGLSALSILGTTLLFSIQGSSSGIQMDLAHYFFVVPIGITVSAVPLLPGGIGVGQVAFYTIFQWTGANPEQGATLCTLMQVYTLVFNFCGGIFYLKYKRQPQPTSASDTPNLGMHKKSVTT